MRNLTITRFVSVSWGCLATFSFLNGDTLVGIGLGVLYYLHGIEAAVKNR